MNKIQPPTYQREALLQAALHTRFLHSSAAAVCAAMVLAGAASAQSISVNFGSEQGSSAVTEAAKMTGAIPVAGNFWNNTTNASGTLGGLQDSNGASTTGSVTWTSQVTYFSTSTGATATSENGDLTKGYLDDGGAGWSATLTSPYLLNDIYVIHASDATSAVMSAVNVNGAYFRGDGTGATIPGTAGGSWSATSWTAADTLIESANFIKLSGQPTVVVSGARGASSRSALAGLQVVNAYSGTLAYWDVNGATAGFGDIPDGTWGSNSFWSGSAAGDTATTAWTAGRAAVFSAATPEDGFTVTVSGTQSADAVWLQKGVQVLSGGVVDISGGLGLVRADGTSELTIDSQINAANLTTVGSIYLQNPANSITGLVTVKSGRTTLEADQSWPQIAGGGEIDVLDGFALTVGSSNLDSTYAGGIQGAFTKAGSGSLTLGAKAGSGGDFNINGGSVVFDTRVGGPINITRMFSGSGALHFVGDGSTTTSSISVSLSNANTGFTGPVTINNARVAPGYGDEFGSGPVNVLAGGQLFLNQSEVANPLTLAGLGTTEPDGQLGAIRFHGGATASGNITLQGHVRLTAWSGGTGTISGPITGDAASVLEKTGAGLLTIDSPSNTGFLGKTRVDGSGGNGTLQLADDASLGNAPASPVADSITLLNGGLLQGIDDLVLSANRGITLSSGNGGFNTQADLTTTVNGPITGGGNLVFTSGAGETVINGSINIAGSVTVNSGTTATLASPSLTTGTLTGYTSTTNLSAANAAIASINLGDATNNAHTLNQTAGNVTTVGGVWVGHWGSETSVYNISGGSLNLPDTVVTPTAENEANLLLGIDGSGILNISGTGVVNTSSLVVNGRSETHNTGGANPQPDTLNLTGGRLNVGKWGIRSGGTTYSVNLGGGTVGAYANWTSSLNMSLTGTNGSTVFNTLDSVDNSTARKITLTGAITGAGGLIKRGAGTLDMMNATKSFTGGVTLEEGTLLFGAGTLGGDLQLLGGTFQPGTPVGAGVVQAPNTTIGGTALTFRVGSSVDVIDTGNVNVTVPTVITAALGGSVTQGQEFTIIDYSGTLTGFGNLSLAALPNPRFQASLVHDTVNKAVKVRIDAADTLVWTGAAGSTWDFSAVSWKLSSTSAPTAFLSQDSVLFDGSNPGTISLAGALDPTLVTVQTPGDYTFNGAGGLAGNARLLKNGTGTLRVENTNSHIGGNEIAGGTLVVASPGALGGSGNVTAVGAGGTLDVNGQNLETNGAVVQSAGVITNTATARAVVSRVTLTGNTEIAANNAMLIGASAGSSGTLSLGGHTLTKSGTGTLFLNGVTTGNGNIVVNGGTLYLIKTYNDGNQLPVVLNGTGTITVNSGASLITGRWATNLDISKAIVLNGGSFGSEWPGPNGATFSAPISVTADSSLTFGGGYGNTTLSGLVTGSGRLTRSGGNEVTFTANNTWTGGLTINSGTVQVGNGGTTGLIGTGPVTNQTTLTFNRSNAYTIANAIGGTGVVIKKGAGNATFTGVNTYTGNTTVEAGALFLGATGKMNFKPGANGVTNRITGPGAVDLRGKFTIDLATADTTPGNSWTLVDVDALAFETFASSFGLDGFTEVADVHTMSSGGNVWTFTEETGVLTVQASTGGNAYETWAQTNGVAGSGPDTDSDGDGIDNGIEFVIGGNPAPGSPSDLDKLPRVLKQGDVGYEANYLTFIYRRTDESVAYDPHVQYSSSLLTNGWTTAVHNTGGVLISESNATTPTTVTVKIPRTLAAGGRLFARLRVDIATAP